MECKNSDIKFVIVVIVYFIENLKKIFQKILLLIKNLLYLFRL